MPADMSITNVRGNCQQNKSYAFSRSFLFLVFPAANFRYTTILQTTNNREHAQTMSLLTNVFVAHTGAE